MFCTVVFRDTVAVRDAATTAAALTPVTPLLFSVPPPMIDPPEPTLRTVTSIQTANGIAVPDAAAVGVMTAAALSALDPAVPIRALKFEAFAAEDVHTPAATSLNVLPATPM